MSRYTNIQWVYGLYTVDVHIYSISMNLSTCREMNRVQMQYSAVILCTVQRWQHGVQSFSLYRPQHGVRNLSGAGRFWSWVVGGAIGGGAHCNGWNRINGTESNVVSICPSSSLLPMTGTNYKNLWNWRHLSPSLALSTNCQSSSQITAPVHSPPIM